MSTSRSGALSTTGIYIDALIPQEEVEAYEALSKSTENGQLRTQHDQAPFFNESRLGSGSHHRHFTANFTLSRELVNRFSKFKSAYVQTRQGREPECHGVSLSLNN